MNKRIASTLIAVLCLSLLTGCANKMNETDTTEILNTDYQYAFEDTGVSPKFYKTAKGYSTSMPLKIRE